MIQFPYLFNLCVKWEVHHKVRHIIENLRLPLVCVQRRQKAIGKTWQILQPVCSPCTLWGDTVLTHHIESAFPLKKTNKYLK